MRVPVVAVIAALIVASVPVPARAAPVTIANGVQFTDTAGAGVHAHGGGVLKAGSYWYWFGENRNADDTFRAVSVYRSADLRTWEFRNNVLTSSSAAELGNAKIERPKVVYNAATGRFVMWMHKENGTDYGEARAAVASASTIDGTYTYHGSFRPLNQHMSRDITLYEEGGTAYMISAADENRDLQIYRLTADYLQVAALVGNFWDNATREAPAMFKRNGVYFMLTSGTSGWNPNQAKYATATSIAGPWSGWTNVGDSTTYGSQPAFVLPVGNAFLYMGDRWAGAWSGPVNDSRYVWLPISFPTSTSMTLTWYPTITIDAAAGTVTGNPATYYRITGRGSGKVLDVVSASMADNAEVKQYAWNGGGNQRFEFRDTGGGYFQIVAQHSGKCLDVAAASTADGANIIQYACGNGANQQWQWAPTGSYYQLKARHSGKCLDVVAASTTDGADIQQYACGSGTNQQWSRTS
ncbi:RICIN domain-containing protein [Paractinoplanes lichenicola]|uniref:RICIN domain-containing protein n=1 Tax=Paractinoplanes lichenicola TaxID=2802976 RepID=A0ABS1VU52_9ACTN|nr:RICIN domain-containing protein [Actinoplanes lichenicola]MBL7258008.1 RICIN domain-containing protein [Actinoplanes lichenicola]